jgi:SAM-dependent methyltransferase
LDNFYEDNHQQYFDSTVGIDPSVFLEPLAGQLKPKATILDIGCGSGRDLLWFAERGFCPTGFEQSSSLASLARKHSNCPVIEGDFSRFNFSELQFSALVFVGSLVHISTEALPAILTSTCQALIPGGLLLITLKEGMAVSLPYGQERILKKILQQATFILLIFLGRYPKSARMTSGLGMC